MRHVRNFKFTLVVIRLIRNSAFCTAVSCRSVIVIIAVIALVIGILLLFKCHFTAYYDSSYGNY